MRTLRLASVLAAIAVALTLYLISCSKTGGGSDVDDGNSPYTILDLKAVAVTDSSITLSWTATGDDADVGTASYYDIRGYDDWINGSNWDRTSKATGDDSNTGTASYYDIRGYDDWINGSNWDSTSKVTGAPKPRPAGQTDSIIVKGLIKDSTYYFALKVGDEAGNWSGQSNCVAGTCFTNFAVTFPDSTSQISGAGRRISTSASM